MADTPPLASEPDSPPPDDAVIGRALVGSAIVLGVLACVAIGVTIWLLQPPPKPVAKATPVSLPTTRDKVQVPLPKIPFQDITASAGITFVHHNGAQGNKLLPETMGGGVAFFDYNNDAKPDLLFVNSSDWPGADAPEKPPTLALYRNEGDGKFTDITAEAGLAVTLYGMGVAVGDYDGDGWGDLFITTIGEDRLFRNVEGKFSDVTAAAGVAGNPHAWGTSCGFLDYDNDADLDLYVGNYLDWNAELDQQLGCTLVGGAIRAYCRPDAFSGAYPVLYRNDGGGKFTDVTKDAGLQIRSPVRKDKEIPLAKSLGVILLDLDDDGWQDIVVANDTVQNLLFHNLKNGTFEEIGVESGIAFDNSGNSRGAMGIDSGRMRNDGMLAIAIGNFTNEPTAMYCARHQKLIFTDDADSIGIGPQSRLLLKFGLFFFDADNDTRLDLMVANGHLDEDISKTQQSQTYEQPPQLYWNCGRSSASEYVPLTTAEVGAELTKPMVGRGASYADIDGDGDLDVVLSSVGGPPRLLRNDQQTGNHWLRLKLKGTRCNAQALGAVVDVHLGKQVLSRIVSPTRSYLSQVELPVSFGLGSATKVDKVRIHWPGPEAFVQELTDVQIDAQQEIIQPEKAP